MPRDMHGRDVKPGDRVFVEFTVREMSEDAVNNVQLVREIEGEQPLILMCQAKQTETAVDMILV